MPYVLTLFVLAPHEDVPISDESYVEIKAANANLPELIGSEEKFDALMENFVELESTVLSLGARHLAFEDTSLTDMLVPRNLISRRILNFLSSARLYRDGLRHHVFRLLGRSHPAASAFLDKLKDSSARPMAYRVVEAIRNYVQHRELPISGISFQRSKEFDSNKEVTAFSHWLAPYIDATEISREKRNNLAPDLIAELEKLGKSVNPLPLLRSYVEYVGSVHVEFRALFKEQEAIWESTLAEASRRYANQCPATNLIALGAGFKHENGTVSQVEYISQDWAEYRKYLRIKHFTAVNFSMRYVKWSV